MRVILLALRTVFYLIAFILFTLVALRFTLDVNSLGPEIAKVISEQTGAEVEVKDIELTGVTGLSISVVDLVFPYSNERKEEWRAYDLYLKQREVAKREGSPPPEELSEPLPMLNVCAHNTVVNIEPLSLWSFVAGGEVEGDLTTNLFECTAYDDPPQPSNAGLLKIDFSVPVAQKLNPNSRRPEGREIVIRYDLSELNLGANEVLTDQSPLKLSGALSLQGEATLKFGRRGRFQLRKSLGSLELEVAELSTGKGTVGGFDLPQLSFGQLTAGMKLERGGKLFLRQFEAKSRDLEMKVSGNVSLSMVLARLGLNVHLALTLTPELMRRSPDMKMLAKQGARMARGKAHIKDQSDGGYEIGVLVKGKMSRPRVTGVAKSPYGEDGKQLGRSKRSNKRADRARRNKKSRLDRSKRSRRPPRVRPKPKRRDRRKVETPKRKRAKPRPRRTKAKRPSRSKRPAKSGDQDQASEVDEVGGSDVSDDEGESDDEEETDSASEAEGDSEGEADDESEGDSEDEPESDSDEEVE